MNYLPIKDFRAMGFLHEINRLVLHPVGLALEVRFDSETGEEWFGGVCDYRDDPEGIIFDKDTLNPQKASFVAGLIESRGLNRQEELGFVIQPLPPEAKQLNVTVKESMEWTERPEEDG